VGSQGARRRFRRVGGGGRLSGTGPHPGGGARCKGEHPGPPGPLVVASRRGCRSARADLGPDLARRRHWVRHRGGDLQTARRAHRSRLHLARRGRGPRLRRRSKGGSPRSGNGSSRCDVTWRRRGARSRRSRPKRRERVPKPSRARRAPASRDHMDLAFPPARVSHSRPRLTVHLQEYMSSSSAGAQRRALIKWTKKASVGSFYLSRSWSLASW
jgi:hypothetical protein